LSFQWDGTGCKGFYFEEEYVQLMQKYLARQAGMTANMVVIETEKHKDVDQTENLSILVGIGREILVLLMCILALVF